MPNLNVGFDDKGRLAAFALFCMTTVQLVFQQPYIVILPDERAKVFSATLCLLTLVVTILFGRGKERFKFGVDFWISLVLTGLAILSGIFSLVPRQSLERVYVIISAGLAGYWCSKFLLTQREFQRIFQWLVSGLLLCVIFLALLGLYLTGKPHEFLDSHWHPVGSRFLIMSFAPLSLALGRNKIDRIAGVTILLLDLVTIFIVGRYAFIQSIMIIPAIVAVIAFFVFKWSGVSRQVMAATLALTIAAGVFFAYVNPKNLDRDHISVAYRIESLFFSVDIATKHPWLGNGLWAPRDSLFEAYSLHYPFVSKEQCAQWVKDQRTSEDLYLTFLADLGIPFFVLYFGSILYLLLKLLRLSQNPTAKFAFHPAAIFLPLVAECLRFIIVDDLFEPQISWFFHILLGLAATGIVASRSKRLTETEKS
jgi:hypothetical protein